jgi:hypothetical protein
MTVYSRKSTLITARSNYSIVSVLDMTTPVKDPPPDLIGFKQAMNWMLDFNAAGIPAITSVVELFWSGQKQLRNEYWDPELATTFQSILVYPIWQFNWNNYGNPNLSAQVKDPNLPKEFYTKASLVQPYTRIVLNEAMFAIFLVGEGIVLVFALVLLLWLCMTTKDFPTLSSFPLVDFAMKAHYDLRLKNSLERDETEQGVESAGNRQILDHLRHCDPIVSAKERVLVGQTCSPSSDPEESTQTSIDVPAVNPAKTEALLDQSTTSHRTAARAIVIKDAEGEIIAASESQVSNSQQPNEMEAECVVSMAPATSVVHQQADQA